MSHFNEQYLADCDARTSDDDILDRHDGVSSKPALSTDPGLAAAQTLAQSLANVISAPTYVVAQDGRYFVQDETDVICYWHDPDNGGLIADAAIVATYAPDPPPPPPTDNPDINSTPTTEGPSPLRRPEWAVTLQSRAIESKLITCGFCQGIHHVQKCPALIAAMAVPVTAEELGGTLCGILWCDPPGFVQLIERLTPERRAEYASAYIAFLHTARPDCRLTVPQVLERWLPAVAEAMHG